MRPLPLLPAARLDARYAPGQGYPEFDRAKATRYFDLVVERLVELISDVQAKWGRGGR